MKYAKVFVPLLIILAILFVLFEKKEKEEDKSVFGTLGEYYFVDTQAVDRVELGKNGSLISIARQDGNWQIEKPIVTLADPKAVDELLKGILENPVHRLLKAGEVGNLSEYGLDVEKETVTLYRAGNVLVDLVIGDTSITGSDLYTKKKGENEVMLTAVQLRDKLIYEPEHYRSRNPLNFDENAVVTIIFTYPDSHLKLEKDKKTFAWYITEPENFLAQNPKVVRFIGQLKRMEIVKFLNRRMPSEESHGLDNPPIKVDLIMDKNETIEMLAGDTDVESNGFYARFSTFPDEDFIIEASMLDKLKVSMTDFKETSLFQSSPLMVESIDVREPSASNLSIYQDDSGQWKRLKPSNGDVDQKKLEEFFHRLREFRPEEYLTGDELYEIGDDVTGFEDYTLKIEVKCKKGCKDIAIIVGNEVEGKGYYVKVSDMAEGAYMINSKLIQAFIDVNTALKS